jgi:hypothetical protein
MASETEEHLPMTDTTEDLKKSLIDYILTYDYSDCDVEKLLAIMNLIDTTDREGNFPFIQ